MAREEAENGRDNMQIDGPVPEPERGHAVPDGFNPDYLKIYYGKLFPHEDIFKWLSYGNDRKHPGCDQSYFGRREFSFTLDNDIYLRFQSFNSVSELKKSINEKCPVKIDIGAVYNVDDITDYDDVRYCCSGADVCLDCWPLMTVAIKVIDVSLRVDFGFNHILWVYSGLRGVHCWVCDGKARRLNDEQRASIANYLYLYKGNENSQKKVSLMDGPMHPFVIRSSKISEKHFKEKLVSSQNLFSNEESFEKILEMIPDESVTSELRGAWQESRRYSNLNGANVSRWELLKCKLQSRKHKVSKQMNHLLKAPFCVHPKTGHVCVPIDPNLCEEFDPTSVPTLSKVLTDHMLATPKF
ncbi:hypothetical protein RHMOL_Rhmol09G0011700 [Rhododendron molle]|uniref:Uncharacterized protein n=2 Tax=Rhododendron molle TaxID=49168 RepID=A0ACC0M9M3_RHOML|nr:hypothetical protein RHMOL_Rhmol09G0011700 [Rhododendron molle]KAI8537290.1 hypothetical protein RHMOL_Rhmol09G0011700 [Rhododendron molle]